MRAPLGSVLLIASSLLATGAAALGPGLDAQADLQAHGHAQAQVGVVALGPAAPPLVDGAGIDAMAEGVASVAQPAGAEASLDVRVSAGAGVEADPHAGTGMQGVGSKAGSQAWPPHGQAAGPADGARAAVADHAAPLAFGATAAAALGLALRAAPAPWQALARALRIVIPVLPAALFSRIQQGEVLDNPVRARVHDAIAQDPGLSTSEVQQRAGVAWGTTIHHLRRLEAHGLLVSVSSHRHRRYYLANTVAAGRRLAMAAVQHPTAHRIAGLVAVRPGIDQSTVGRTLGLSGSAVSKHVAQLRGHGLVQTQRDGRNALHHPTTALHDVLALMGGPPPMLLAAQEPDGMLAPA